MSEEKKEEMTFWQKAWVVLVIPSIILYGLLFIAVATSVFAVLGLGMSLWNVPILFGLMWIFARLGDKIFGD